MSSSFSYKMQNKVDFKANKKKKKELMFFDNRQKKSKRLAGCNKTEADL